MASKGPDMSQEASNLRVLLELTQTLTSTLDFKKILYTLVSRIAEIVHVDRVSLVLVPPNEHIGYVVAASDDAKLQRLPLSLKKYPEIRHVLDNRKPLTIHDVNKHPLLDGVRGKVSASNVRALSLLPIQFEDEVMGVLFIRSATGNGALTHDQIELCQILTNATAVALRNARTLHNLREDTKRDTQARKNAERRLESLGRYADLFESAVDGVIAFDGFGKLLFANPAAYALLGAQQSAELSNARLIDWIAPESQRQALVLSAAFRKGHFPRDVDVMVRGDKEVLTINGSFSALKGTADAVLFSFRDVTKSHAIQQEFERTRHFLQSMIDASVDAIVAADMQGRILLFNDAAQRLYGYTRDQAKNDITVNSLYPELGAREVGRLLRSPTHGGRGRLLPTRLQAINSKGMSFPISLTAATIYDGDRPTATFGIFTDLRERIRVERQLEKAQERLAVSEKQMVVAELAGAMAHELNQPLTGVMASAELLQRKLGDNSEFAHTIERMNGEAKRIAEIVYKIGHLTRYETTAYVGSQKILDLDRAAAEEDTGGSL